MNNCSKYKLECETGKYELNRRLKMDDVKKFFGNGQKCSTQIVYISKNAPVHISEVMVKNVDEECNYLYREKNGWFFIYTQLFNNILLWSAHPRMFGKEGFVGNHLSIGEVNGVVTIHQTTYSSKMHHIGQYNIIWDKTSIWYNTYKGGSLRSNSVEAVGLWNNIAAEANKTQSGSGGLKVVPIIMKTKKQIIKETKLEKKIMDRIKKVKEYINKPDAYMVSVRIPYTRENSEVINIIKKIDASATWVKNDDAKTSFILFNFE
jgi:hypothetical protein